jgi:hypothetical protein
MAMGLPFMSEAIPMAPFDAIADYLRGTRGIMTDMYRQPDKLLEAIDRITPLLIEDAISLVNSNKGFIVWLALHKAMILLCLRSVQKILLALVKESDFGDDRRGCACLAVR